MVVGFVLEAIFNTAPAISKITRESKVTQKYLNHFVSLNL